MIIELDNSKTTEFILDHYNDLGATIKKVTIFNEWDSQEINVIDLGKWGEWFVFALNWSNACTKFTLIRADSFEEAFETFLDQFEGEEPGEYGQWVGDKFFSECTLASVTLYKPERIELEVGL